MSKVASVVFSNFGQSEVHGYVMFSQSTPSDAVRIRGEVFNLSPDGAHGFHVHESGDLRSGCTSAKGHFNPYGAVHGAPTDAERHVGDLGNIFAEGGTARFDYVDLKISLFEGSNNIIGRSVVVHQGRDDLGRGLDAGSKIHGNAGPRLACGVIGIVAP
ncbi:unnamed protein product [Cyprideis torosa]|uniref:Superoxide dismutase [Cu-Zn] n=1 Tax=Cyprideis torosa TaxID=163714 RepID=A0A7R8ZJ60_9CRUS|nr:unnamed protein product [Cyprideis torosa]CAG0887887.1 unnamed protein product [Cyprideis torosa]